MFVSEIFSALLLSNSGKAEKTKTYKRLLEINPIAFFLLDLLDQNFKGNHKNQKGG